METSSSSGICFVGLLTIVFIVLKLTGYITWKWLFSVIYKRWLWNPHSKDHDKVLEVLGWRTARIESSSGGRQVISPCFKIFGIKFD